MIDRQVRLLSIRQPWAWAIVQGGKDVENRSYPNRYRGTVLIHASKGCTRAEYEEACESIAEIAHLTPPPLTGIERGGIIGKAVIGACVANSNVQRAGAEVCNELDTANAEIKRLKSRVLKAEELLRLLPISSPRKLAPICRRMSIGKVPQTAVAVRLYRITPNDKLLGCEAILFAGGADAIDTTLRRARISGHVEIGGDIQDHFADLLDPDGSMIETVALDRASYAALKNRWMRCRVERPGRRL